MRMRIRLTRQSCNKQWPDPLWPVRHTISLTHLLESLLRVHPSFLTAHTAGQQCVVPAI